MRGAVLVAGGTGARFGRDGGKQLAFVAGRPLLAYALAALESCDLVDEIVVVGHPDRLAEFAETVVGPLEAAKVTGIVPGGDTRQASVAAGVSALSPEARIVLVHDGARPCATAQLFSSAIMCLEADDSLDGVVVGHPAYDTVKRVDDSGVVVETPDRASLWVAQTPQVFRRDVLDRAMRAARQDGHTGTDDAAIVEAIGGRVMMLLGPRGNVKVTVPEDLLQVEAILAARAAGEE